MEIQLKIKMYRDMVRIRKFEEKLRELFALGELPGFIHLYLGEEAVAVGACSALQADDYITSTHRGHGHVIAKGADTRKMMAELYGKTTGYGKGRSGSMHIAEPNLGIMGANGIVGGGIPLATGAAFSSRYLKNNRVTVCFFGDGASNQGTFHESLNIASAFDLPCIYICENNLYASSTRYTAISKTVDISARASAYGMPGFSIDGNDVEKVYSTVSEAVSHARSGKGPSLIECKTYRWQPHGEGLSDWFRSNDEKLSWKSVEPIGRYRKILIEDGILTHEGARSIENEALTEIAQAVDYAKSSPDPELVSALDDVYSR